MSWTKQTATRWSRALDCHDKLFQSIAAAGKPLGREHWLLVGTAQVSFTSRTNAALERLRRAWAALRILHPDVALELYENEKHYEPITSDEALEKWVTSTFHVENTAISGDELFSRYLKVAEASATCHWIPESSEVAIVSSHWRWDGRGLLMMLHEFLKILAADKPVTSPASFGSEVERLVPSIDVVMGVPDQMERTWLHRADELLAPYCEGSPSCGLPIIAASLPGDTRRAEVVLSQDTTATVLAACRARQIRLTAALHASVIRQTGQHQSDSNQTALYKCWAPFDLRKYCPAPFDGPWHAPSLRMVALPIVVDVSTDWCTLATYLQSVYGLSFAPENDDLIYIRVPFVEQATAMLAKAVPTTEPNLGNLGSLDGYIQKSYGDVAVQNVWLAVQMLSPQLYIHAWSWNQELHISVCYNEAFYKAEFVDRWLAELQDSLLKNLEVLGPKGEEKGFSDVP